MKTKRISRKDVVWAILIVATILGITSAIGLERSKFDSVWSLISVFGIIVGPGMMLTCLYFLKKIIFEITGNKNLLREV